MDHQFDESYPFVYIGHVCSSVYSFEDAILDVRLLQVCCFNFWGKIFSTISDNIPGGNTLSKLYRCVLQTVWLFLAVLVS